MCLVLMLALVVPARAQLSPGPLSRAHEHLEGLRKCGSCHALGKRDVGERCLGCHQEIAAMRRGGDGLHARPEYRTCVDCHVEHQGRDYALVHWPEGRDGFGHGVTGFALELGHAGKDCRACHKAGNIPDPDPLVGAGKDLDRTFLGLEAACRACHADPHAGQFRQDCTACHDASTWKPAPLFDHAATRYPLTGKHQPVACAACHKPAAPSSAVVFAGLEHGACTDCHRDPHAGALGPRCAECHSTAGWQLVQGVGFDHERTAYPLRGRHAAVTCAACHEGRGAKPACARCSDCHRDEHGGAARGRPGWLACERCHEVAGFRPARFGLAAHDTTAFPLAGAHRAAPCGLCHDPAARTVAPRTGPVDLAPPAAVCTACHLDPHRWTAPDPPACTACHDQDSWRDPAFAHGTTRFPLHGRHETTACTACHTVTAGAERKAPAFGGESRECVGCHRDPHGGTMTRTAAEIDGIDCARCHVTTDWLAENFDHDRDSGFALLGAHATVACRACHRAPDGQPLLVFRPLAADCVSCHPVGSVAGMEKP